MRDGPYGVTTTSPTGVNPAVAAAEPEYVQLGFGKPQWRRYLWVVTAVGALTAACCLAAPVGIRYLVGCQSPQCDDWVQDMSLSIDARHGPCDDFYEFVCGKWEDTQGQFMNAFMRLQIRVALSFFKRVLLLDAKSSEHRAGNARLSSALLVQRCMQEAFNGIENMGFVTEFLSQYNLNWPPIKLDSSNSSLLDVLVELCLVRDVHLVFRLVPDVYFKKPGRYILHLQFSYMFFYEWAALRKVLITEGRLHSFYEQMGLLLAKK